MGSRVRQNGVQVQALSLLCGWGDGHVAAPKLTFLNCKMGTTVPVTQVFREPVSQHVHGLSGIVRAPQPFPELL